MSLEQKVWAFFESRSNINYEGLISRAMVQAMMTCWTPPLMPKESWYDSNSSAATANRFILTIALHPKRVRTDPAITGRRVGSVVEVLSSGSFL